VAGFNRNKRDYRLDARLKRDRKDFGGYNAFVGMRALFIQLSIALLTLIVPEIWKDTFEGLRRSQYWRFIQIAVIIWIAVVVWIAVSPSVIYWANRNRTFAVIIASAVGAVIFGTVAWQGLSGSRLARPLMNGRSDIAKPAGLKIVIALPGINEEKDLIASADGATIALFNDSPSVLKDLHEILRFPTLKSAEVLDKYKSRASITGGGKPGSDYMVIEIPELRPTQRVGFTGRVCRKAKSYFCRGLG
jgi:hypothetical protein